ncbi:MAG: hypothetical protein J7L89_00060, partial [Bacteroidales bacterium]|nr:hypothetical protein [Bacteroidales bacterium]
THQTRYFQPALSPSAGRIAVVEESVTGRSSLLIISRLSGIIMSKVDAPPFEHFTGPVWDLNGSGVYAFLTGVNGRKLIRWVTGQDRIAVIRDFTYKEVNHLAVADNRLIFTAPVGSTEGLYQLKFDGSGLSLIGGHSQGVSYPVISGNQLFCSVYSVNGFRPAATELKNLKPEKIRQIPDLDEPMNALVQRTPGEVPVDKILSDTTFQIQPYPRWRRLLHFHSWAPVYIDPVGYQVNPGVVLMSQNELNTLSVWGGYQYLFSRSMHQMVANIHYTGMFPEITMSFAGGPVFDSLAGEGTLGHYNSWSQWMHATVTIPLNFSSGIWYRNLSLSVALVAHQNRVLQSGLLLKEDYLAGAIVSGYILRRQSHRDLYPKWGVRANMTTHYNPSGHQASLMMWSKFYLPGLLPQHSIRMYASGYFNLSPSQFPAQSWDLPRGVSGPDLFYPYNVRMDYGFPFLYPDWNVGSLLYLKRLKANLFTDLAFTKSLALASLSSGLDLTADFFLLRIGAAINGGCRIIYLPLENRWKVWPLVGFSIN